MSKSQNNRKTLLGVAIEYIDKAAKCSFGDDGVARYRALAVNSNLPLAGNE